MVCMAENAPLHTWSMVWIIAPVAAPGNWHLLAFGIAHQGWLTMSTQQAIARRRGFEPICGWPSSFAFGADQVEPLAIVWEHKTQPSALCNNIETFLMG